MLAGVTDRLWSFEDLYRQSTTKYGIGAQILCQLGKIASSLNSATLSCAVW
jgi:hypothetical protein